ncbi:Lob domain-containing protein [Thalictrum thalictroides]|uniref:Lob domain-containing protein n=1 Tax=Thalictrum thalictroides TaxID=46969 RepID=A0A7J6VLT6_THATH|nr:Lob domain-containing protein [Thalictrum thalictroides]
MTVKGGTSQACAACKYQRRKCAPDCALAPYFPPDQPKMFQNAHRLYGVSNILKILKMLNPSQKKEAMQSIIYQSNIREKYPVHGCLGVIACLEHCIHQTKLELEDVMTQINIYRQHHQNQIQISSPLPQYSPSSHLQLATDSKNVLSLFQQNPQSFDLKDNSLWIQHQYNNNNNNMMSIQSHLFPSQAFPLQQQLPAEVLQDYDEISPAFFDVVDDRQSYIDSKEAYESSSESSMRDTKHLIDDVAENELKIAAARFSLTSIT